VTWQIHNMTIAWQWVSTLEHIYNNHGCPSYTILLLIHSRCKMPVLMSIHLPSNWSYRFLHSVPNYHSHRKLCKFLFCKGPNEQHFERLGFELSPANWKQIGFLVSVIWIEEGVNFPCFRFSLNPGSPFNLYLLQYWPSWVWTFKLHEWIRK